MFEHSVSLFDLINEYFIYHICDIVHISQAGNSILSFISKFKNIQVQRLFFCLRIQGSLYELSTMIECITNYREFGDLLSNDASKETTRLPELNPTISVPTKASFNWLFL